MKLLIRFLKWLGIRPHIILEEDLGFDPLHEPERFKEWDTDPKKFPIFVVLLLMATMLFGTYAASYRLIR